MIDLHPLMSMTYCPASGPLIRPTMIALLYAGPGYYWDG